MRRDRGAGPGSTGHDRQLLTAELVVRASWGVVLLVAPGRVLGLTAGNPARQDGAALVVARILGARHLLQAAGGSLVPGRTERRLAAAVDGVHALACVALAVAAPRYARGALVDASLATTWCVLSVRTARASGPRGS